MNLLSDNDLRVLHNAICDGQEISISRRLKAKSVTARTINVKPPWLVHTILQVRRECGNVIATQNFVSVDELKSLWEEW